MTETGRPCLWILDLSTSHHHLPYCDDSTANMVDRATRYHNAVHQIQERNKPSQPHAVDIPDNTLERHAKTVSPFIASLSVSGLSAPDFCPFPFAQVPQPVTARPTNEQFWLHDHHGHPKPNAEFLREHFLREGRLTDDQAVAILRQCTDMLSSEPNVLKVKSPVTGMSFSYSHLHLRVESCFV